MGKHGPCYHCGVTSTPLWRNGPPDKPVLCNACGSRWRTKGTLENYAPLHMREAYELDVHKRPKEKTASFKFKVKSLQKGKWSSRITEAESGTGDYSQSFAHGADEDTSNRSSSGSSVSFSESCVHFSSVDASEVTGSIQSDAWETAMPSWKRTSGVRPKRSAVEKLTKDLHSIMHEQSSYLTVSSEEDLLFETHSQTGLIEIGNGSVLIRHPNSAIIEEESEASSPPLQNKSTSLGFSLIMECQSKGSVDSNMSNAKAKSSPPEEQSERNKSSKEKFHILRNKDSKLSSIDLEAIVCFEGYMKYLTCEERQQLMKYLPLVDTMEPPESLKRMFDSLEFSESLSSYQHLLEEGIFDLSASEMKSDDCKIMRKLILSNLTKSVWVESYKAHKDAKASNDGGQGERSFLGCSSRPDLKRPREIHNDNFAEPKTIMKTLKKTCKTSQSSPLSVKSKRNPSELGKKSKIESSSYFDSINDNDHPKSPSAPASQKSCIFYPLQLADVNHDEELLLDVRSSTSFPEAELLPDVWLQKAPAKRSCTESEVSGKESNLLCQSAVSFTSINPKQW